MAQTVSSVTLDNPVFDPNLKIGRSFYMDGTATLSGGGGSDYDAHHQWDQGSGRWTDLVYDAAGLSTASTNPKVHINGTAIATLTVVGNIGGTYSVRIRTVDHNDADAEGLSGEQKVTVRRWRLFSVT